MCDCTPLPSSPLEIITRSRTPSLHKPRSISTIKSPTNSPNSKPSPTRIICSVRARSSGGGDDFKPTSTRSRAAGTGREGGKYESLDELAGDGATLPSSFEFPGSKREPEEDELVLTGSSGDADESGAGGLGGRMRRRRGRQVMRRSNLLAKQVISIRSACSLGFVSQLWVDTRSWEVVLVEVRPNLLSGDIEKFLLEDVCQVGDVVLVQDESVMENELKMIGLDTLVGYNVVTSGRQNVGKVRGYAFNINSGSLESLELDSFGFAIIPASLVSTYCLLIEDVLEVISDIVVVREDAISRLQRLTKGILNARNDTIDGDEMRESYEVGRRQSVRRGKRKSSGHKFPSRMRDMDGDVMRDMDGDETRESYEVGRGHSVHRGSGERKSDGHKFPSRMGDMDDEWDLPMDY